MASERQREASLRASHKATNAAQDIGPPPPVVDPERRAACAASLRLFCEAYFPQRFSLAWSPDHLSVLARLEEAIVHGGLFALAMPRGSGKTSLAEVACLWAAMTGRHRFVLLLAVSATRGNDLLENAKVELLTNDALHEDWPEITHPIRALEDRANRAKGQHIEGAKTFIAWRKNQVILPTVAGSAASGTILRVAGLAGGGIRGLKATRPADGVSVRPSLVVLDDPQDDTSARSPYQCEKRHRLVHGSVLGVAGPGKKVTAVALCTVIAPGDLADQLLDRQKSPLWTGQRYKLLPRFPERMDLWDEYGTKRADEFRNDGDGKLATAWYGQQKEVMDRGAIVSWPERHNPEELSALQHAMNLYYQDAESFMAEFQNEPLVATLGEGQLKAELLVKRGNGLARDLVPVTATRLTAYVDVQGKLLYWLVAAWSDDFTGSVVAYGSYPDQQRAYFSLADAQHTLGRAAPGTGLEGSIHAGLTALAGQLLGREWQRDGGGTLRIEKMLVDANWGQSTDAVYAWSRGTPYASVVMPSHGKYVGAGSKPWSEYIAKPGERLGTHWLVPAATGKRAIRYLLIDTNFWKSFIAERLLTAPGDRAALMFHAGDHRLLADHLTAEYRVRTEGRGRVVDEWKAKPERQDNHWLDCLAGAAAAASMQGARLFKPAAEVARPSWREIQQRKAGGPSIAAAPAATTSPTPETPPARKSWKEIQREKRA